MLKGEDRPAGPCSRVQLLASGYDEPVPPTGVLEVPLAGEFGAARYIQIVSEAYVYASPAAELFAGRATKNIITRTRLASLPRFLSLSFHARMLEVFFGDDPAFTVAPQPRGGVVRGIPKTHALHFDRADRGQLAVFAVWGWPVTAHPVQEITVEALRPGSGDSLAVAFGVHEPGWYRGSPPVVFEVSRTSGGKDERDVLFSRTLDPARRESDRGWQEAEIPLDRDGGRDIQIVLTARAEGSRGTGGFPTWARPALVRPARQGRDLTSILLLSLDTLRADHVGAYGYRRATTPNLDRLAADGVLFEQVIAPFPSTTGSHMSMLTSLEPCEHGVLSPTNMLAQAIPTVTGNLAARGYATVAITENGLIRGSIGFNRGFDSYRDLVGTGTEPLGLFAKGLALARQWLDRHRTRPFFMFLHTYQVHTPYKIPEKYRGLFPVEADASEARRQEADYDAGLRYADELVGGLVGFLEEHGLLERTLLVVTSDHGTEFGDHGGIGHARGVYEEQVRVPLIVRHPELASGGRRVSIPVGLVDLAPTFLEVSGADGLPGVRGISLFPFLRGDDGGGVQDADRRLFAEQLWGSHQTLLRTGRHAWIQMADGIELYDLRDDPREQSDIAARKTVLASEGARGIEQFRRACRERRRTLCSGKVESPLEPERIEALRALGYIQ